MKDHGRCLMSRSEAIRMLAEFKRSREVVLDFSKFEFIGQAFADEIFRVFKRDHPETRIVYSGANDAIRRMIEFVQRASDAKSPEG